MSACRRTPSAPRSPAAPEAPAPGEALAEEPEAITSCDPSRLEALGLSAQVLPAMVALTLDYRSEVRATLLG